MGTVIIWFITFVTMMATKTNEKLEVCSGMVVGSSLFIGALMLCCFAMISVIQQVGSLDAPNIAMASNVWKPLGYLFSVATVLGIYTTAVPLLWTPVSRFTKDGSKKSLFLAIGLGVLGLIIALFVPYKTIINYVMNVGGYVTYVLYIFMFIKCISFAFSNIKKRRKKFKEE